MQKWLESKELIKSAHEDNPHLRAEEILNVLSEKTAKFFFFTEKLAGLKRREQRECNENRRFSKWLNMDSDYNEKLDFSKKQYYKKEISKLKKSNPRK